ncbi:diguanylate cyclase regulator RdcB family protein [Escherichia coli]
MNRASKFLPAGVLGRISAAVPGRCFIVLEELRWGAFGDACRLGSPQAVALLLGDLRVKATQHLAESINAPTTRHYYHQWFASSTVPTGGDDADFLSWLGKWTTADKQPVCWSVTQRWQTVALGMPRLCSAQRLAGAMLRGNLLCKFGVNNQLHQ